jgi:hypothetical protein
VVFFKFKIVAQELIVTIMMRKRRLFFIKTS